MTDERLPLPHLLSQLADVVGVGRAIAFARAFGGGRVSVPTALDDDDRIVEILGRAGADHLCALYGGEWIEVPLGPIGTIAEARRRMIRALDAGASIDAAARGAGMHRRTAYRLRRKMKDGRQGLLFPLDD